MKIKTLLVAGIVGVAVVAGVFEALSSPRKREEPGGKKKEEEGKTKGPGGGNGRGS